MIKKIKQMYADSKSLLFYPDGLNLEWDRECDESFEKFLDYVHNILMITMISYVLTGQVVLLIQYYGK